MKSWLEQTEFLINDYNSNEAPSAEVSQEFLRALKYNFEHLDELELQSLHNEVMAIALKLAYSHNSLDQGIQLLALYMQKCPSIEPLRHLSVMLQSKGEFERGILTAKEALKHVTGKLEAIFARYILLRGLLSAGNRWNEASEQDSLLRKEIFSLQDEDFQGEPELSNIVKMFCTTFWLPYMQDNPVENSELHWRVGYLAGKELIMRSRRKPSGTIFSSKLKVGFMSQGFKHHSVGHMSRHLLEGLDRDKLDIHLYFLLPQTNDRIQDYFEQLGKSRKINVNSGLDLAEIIAQDDLDVLVDMDSRTLDFNVEALCYRPARRQISWLGWDDVHLPTMDAFIADPYVLPPNAQDYYHVPIHRMPHTYVATGGFDVGCKTLTRQNLYIPDDAIVYLSAQRAFKFNPETMTAQLEIIREVPNSYLLVKGLPFEDYLDELCLEVGVSRKRVIQYPASNTEADHRLIASVVADVVLDSWPYAGATTTLETLWGCTPIVTRVGQQFSSRTTYSALMNIDPNLPYAETYDDYVRLGVKASRYAFRSRFRNALFEGRKTAPLFNIEMFCRDFEGMLRAIA